MIYENRIVCGIDRRGNRTQAVTSSSQVPRSEGRPGSGPKPAARPPDFHVPGCSSLRGISVSIPQTDRDAWKRSREVVTSPANRRPYSDGDAPGNRPSNPRGGKGGVWPHLGLCAGSGKLEYLIRKRLTGRAHCWFHRDTLCRMASTGGLNPGRYKLVDYNPGLPVCTMCRRIARHQGFTLD